MPAADIRLKSSDLTTQTKNIGQHQTTSGNKQATFFVRAGNLTWLGTLFIPTLMAKINILHPRLF